MLNAELSRRSLLRTAAGGTAAAALAASGARSAGAAPARQGEPGGQITIAWGRYPITFNPLNAIGGIERTVWQLTTSRLINKDVTGAIIPDFAESYEISEDGLTYTFHLVNNATWTDGTPVTARDVEYTYTRSVDPATGDYGASSQLAVIEGVSEFLAGTADTVSGIKVVDDYTIQFVLPQPDAALLNAIAGYYGPYLVPVHILESVTAAQFPDADYNVNPAGRVGMGAYILSEAEKDQFLVFTRNDNYFKGAPLIDQFNYRVMQPDVALAALLNGEVDVSSIPPKDFATVKDEGAVRLLNYPTNLWNGLMFKMTNEALADPRIHQAVVHALDRQTFCDRVLSGLGIPWDSIYVQEQWLSPNIVNYEYDPEKAKALLAEAEWDGDQTVDWKYYGSFRDLAPVLQQALADVGFKINPIEVETATWVETVVQNGEFDFSVVGGGGITDDPSELYSYFQCDAWSRYCNQDLLDLFVQGRQTIDAAERKPVYDQIQEIVNRDLPWFPLYASIAAVGFSSRVHEVAYSSYDYLFYEDWWVEG
jgi:peptide/nickel transport system substrate-binding protein